MDDLENEVSERIIKNTTNRIISAPSDIFGKLMTIIPNPLHVLTNPITFPIIILSLLLLYLSGNGDILTKNPIIVGGLLLVIFLCFIISKLVVKPSWQEVMI